MPASTQSGRPRLDPGGDAWSLLLLVGAYLVVAWIIPPSYEVPQNDDWAYRIVLEQWTETGRLAHLGWNDPTLVFQLFWGAGFAHLFGLSYTTLRLSTLVLSVTGVLSLYGILRWTGTSRSLSLVGASLLLFNPLHLILSYSFNTDVPYLGLATAATLLFLVALERARLWLFLAAGIVSACAFLVRQPGILIPVVVSVYLLLGREDWRKRLAAVVASLGPALLALQLHAAWMSGQTSASWLERASNLHPFFREGRLAQLLNLLAGAALSAADTVMTLGLFLVPLTLGISLARPGRLAASRRLRWALAASLALLALAAWISIGRQPGPWQGWPYRGNYLTRGGGLPQFVVGEVGPAWAWNALTLVVPILGAWLLALGLDALVRPRGGLRAFAPTLVFCIAVAQFLPSFAQVEFYDRYLLVLLPGSVVLAASWMPAPRRGWPAALLVLALFVAASVEYARAYVDRSKAAWGVAEALVARGASPEQIRLGFEWEGSHLYLEALRRFGHGDRFDFQRGFPWDPLLDPRYTIREFAAAPTEPFAAYRPFFGMHPRFVGVVPIPSSSSTGPGSRSKTPAPGDLQLGHARP